MGGAEISLIKSDPICRRSGCRTATSDGLEDSFCCTECANGLLQEGDKVNFWSRSHKKWVETQVMRRRDSGAVQLSCKMGHWMSLEEQEAKLKPVAVSEDAFPWAAAH